MTKSICILTLFCVIFNSYSQDIKGTKIITKPKYSESSPIRVIYKDSLNTFHSNKKPTGVFINGTFAGDESLLNAINSEKIESMSIEKESFDKHGKEYYGKILIKMKSEYNPKFITLKKLIQKYVELDKSPIIFQINENVIDQDYKNYLVDENFILKIIVRKVKTSEKSTEINVIKLITKTKENIKEANIIRIKGL